MHSLGSLECHGDFERFPEVRSGRIVIAELPLRWKGEFGLR